MKGFLIERGKALSVKLFPREGKGEENYRELTNPNLRLPQSLPLRSEQELQSIASTLQKQRVVNRIAEKEEDKEATSSVRALTQRMERTT